MDDPLSLVGWPLHMAIFDLVTGPWQARAQDVLVFEAHPNGWGSPNGREDTAGRRLLWLDICAQLMMGKLVAKGFLARPTTLADTVNVQTIEPQFFSGAVADYDRNTVTMSNGAVFVDVRIFRPAAIAEPAVGTPGQPIRTAGGRSPQHDWISFTREVVRFANLDGFGTRRELMAHMQEWCAANMASAPETDTIRRKVVELCPVGIPEK